ncbi:hypothetical protein Xvie_01289 [Xenorhabdus vietnamensis]|uniref:Uncharacterized protein n=1 Tax=Xenorhabdus vietnamensis TaxID=351656 RepID=A0A1Y2SGA6_9GAMM|nr:hypothetical protein Xvie_01289 [Xenorhabdus vietnamensis]
MSIYIFCFILISMDYVLVEMNFLRKLLPINQIDFIFINMIYTLIESILFIDDKEEISQYFLLLFLISVRD